MADQKTNARIVLSRHTIGIYEANGLPTGPVEQSMGMIREEISTLREIVARHPEKALTLGDLIGRWEAIFDRLRVRAN